MKITWFGRSTFRIYVGGKIVVMNPDDAPAHLVQEELRAGADQTLDLSDLAPLAAFDPQSWQKSRPARLVDETDSEPEVLNVWRFGLRDVLIDAPIEETVTFVSNAIESTTPIAIDGVWVIWGDAKDIELSVEKILTNQRPSVIALATTDVTDTQMQRLAQLANGRTILILEPELALEV